MNNDEARFILSAYRPNGADASDPVFTGALEHATRDPQLTAWQAKELRFDRSIADKLREVQPPPHLRATLLAGRNLKPTTRVRPRFTAWSYGMAAAVLLVLALSLGYPAFRAHQAPEALLALAQTDLQEGEHGGAGPLLQQWQTRLGDPTGSPLLSLASDFDRLREEGCRSLDWFGQPIIEICFQRPEGELHLYVMRSPRTSARNPVAHLEGRVPALQWVKEGFIYTVVGENSPAVAELFRNLAAY